MWDVCSFSAAHEADLVQQTLQLLPDLSPFFCVQHMISVSNIQLHLPPLKSKEVADTSGDDGINSSETKNRVTDPCAHGLVLKYCYIKLTVHLQSSEFLPHAQVKKANC